MAPLHVAKSQYLRQVRVGLGRGKGEGCMEGKHLGGLTNAAKVALDRVPHHGGDGGRF